MNTIKTVGLPLTLLIILVLAYFYRNALLEVGHRFLVKNSSVSNSVKQWLPSVYCETSLKSPYPLQLINTQIPPGSAPNIKALASYVSAEGGYFVSLLCLDTNYEEYDVKTGLTGTISNLVNAWRGSDLELTFQRVDKQPQAVTCSGTVKLTHGIGAIQGYTYWNGRGRIVAVVAISENNRADRQVLKSIINSVDIRP